MLLVLNRYSISDESTLGTLHRESEFVKEFLGYTLEDTWRAFKVKGETCIPEGLYEVKFRRESSPKTTQYSNQYPWFSFHLELQDVEDFQHVYIHIGNNKGDTEGCILFADTANNNTISEGFIGNSRIAFKRLYQRVEQELLDGEKVFIRVENGQHR